MSEDSFREDVLFIVDASSSMAHGSRYGDDSNPSDFRYEPWESTIEMLNKITETGISFDVISGSSGPRGVTKSYRFPDGSDALHGYGPAGWHNFDEVFLFSTITIDWSKPKTIFIVDRGPTFQKELIAYLKFIITALNKNLNLYWIPIGNEPGTRLVWPYPYKKLGLRADQVIYYPNFKDTYDYSMLPGVVASEITEVVGGRCGYN